MCARGVGTHGCVLNVHTEAFWMDRRGFPACNHTPQHKTRRLLRFVDECSVDGGCIGQNIRSDRNLNLVLTSRKMYDGRFFFLVVQCRDRRFCDVRMSSTDRGQGGPSFLAKIFPQWKADQFPLTLVGNVIHLCSGCPQLASYCLAKNLLES